MRSAYLALHYWLPEQSLVTTTRYVLSGFRELIGLNSILAKLLSTSTNTGTHGELLLSNSKHVFHTLEETSLKLLL